jgi:hypothetical protein
MKISNYLIIYFFLLFSCVPEAGVETRNYILINNSGKELRIEFYFYNIFKNSKIVNKEGVLEMLTKESMGRGITPLLAFDADSIIVTYDNEKRQIYTEIVQANYQNVNPKLRNILEDDNYSIDGEGNYIFTFTEGDYENAEKL